MLYAERQQQMHFLRMSLETMAHNVASSPGKYAVASACVHKPIVRCNAGDIFWMQSTHANQAKMIATVDVKHSTDAGDDYVLLSTSGESHRRWHLITN